jgi:hypothetical protein
MMEGDASCSKGVSQVEGGCEGEGHMEASLRETWASSCRKSVSVLFTPYDVYLENE